MPFITLEYSDNIIEKTNIAEMFLQLHAQLSPQLNVPPTVFFSSAVAHQHYCVGSDDKNSAFVHLNFKLMKGRTPEVLQQIAQLLSDKLKNSFAESAKKFQLRTTVEIIELQRTPLKEGYALSTQLPLSLVA